VRESQSVGGHPVDVRRRYDFLAVAAEIAIAQIIGHDPNQIRPVSRQCRMADNSQECDDRNAKKCVVHKCVETHSPIGRCLAFAQRIGTATRISQVASHYMLKGRFPLLLTLSLPPLTSSARGR
jgi:hypothetical protein